MVSISINRQAVSHEDTMAFCDPDSSQTWVDEELLRKLILYGEEKTIHVAGIHATSPIQSKKVELGPEDSAATNNCDILVNSHKNLVVGEQEYDLRPLKRRDG